ncbi:MAG: hypothetical protein V7727_11060 [Sneathiella sp.]
MPSWFYRGQRKNTVEEALTLNLSRLIKQGSIVPGKHVKGQLTWTSSRTGDVTATIGYEADLFNKEDAWLRLIYTVDGETRDYRIYLTTTVPNYGGLRWWFICPITGDKTYTLHTVGGRKFASRKVYNIGYQSQQESKLYGSLTRAQNIRERLGGSCDVTEMFPSRPKGMWRRTHWRWFLKYEKALGNMNSQIGGRFKL